MTKQEIAALACRILAIVTFIRLLETSSYAFNSLASELLNPSLPTPTISPKPLFLITILLQFSPLALLLMFALFLWTQADLISAKMVGGNNESMIKIAVDAKAQALAFSVLGGYLLTQALPQIAQMTMTFLVVDDQLPDQAQTKAPDATFLFFQLALGLCLLFGVRGLVVVLANIRHHLGRDARPGEESEADKIPVRPEN